MEFHQLKTFITVARTGNVTKAASELNTTPPSVSGHIKLLEEEFGVILFTRTSRGMKITPQGEILKSRANDILMASNEFYKTAHAFQNIVKGHLKLGINADPDCLKISESVKNIYKKYPGLNLEIIPSNTEEILQSVETGELDCGFVFGEHASKHLDFIPLTKVDLVIVIPTKFKAKYAHASYKDIAELPWIMPSNLCPFLNTVRAILDKKGIELTNTVFANDDIIKTALINDGVAVTVLEKQAALDLVHDKKVFIWKGSEPLETSLSIINSKQRPDDILIKTLVYYIQKTWKC
ncbi:MAG: LysR family transcriptional regulator [Desulfobacteraceae bacterium]|nr:LysR family transcriptional regulator [Desulfobacteraceae bacterium]